MDRILDPEDLPIGWEKLCLSLNNDIRQLIEDGTVENFYLVQLKEKYGEMRLYFDADKGYEELNRLIDDYSHVSFHTCARCGAFPATKCSTGWILPLCEKCAPKDATDLNKFEPVRSVRRWFPDGKTEEESYDTSYVVDRIAKLVNNE